MPVMAGIHNWRRHGVWHVAAGTRSGGKNRNARAHLCAANSAGRSSGIRASAIGSAPLPGDPTRPPPLGNLPPRVPARPGIRQSGARRLVCRSGHRIRLRMDHDGPGLCALRGLAVARAVLRLTPGRIAGPWPRGPSDPRPRTVPRPGPASPESRGAAGISRGNPGSVNTTKHKQGGR